MGSLGLSVCENYDSEPVDPMAIAAPNASLSRLGSQTRGLQLSLKDSRGDAVFEAESNVSPFTWQSKKALLFYFTQTTAK